MANLYLSHWNSVEKVYVPANISNKLKPYHLSIVRSLYRCWLKKFDGAILSYDEGVDVPLAFQALWQALINANKVKFSFLIIVSDDNLIIWHYYLSQLGEVFILNSQNREAVLDNAKFSIILVPHSNIKLLQAHEDNEFSFIVVEDFDRVATTRLFKRLSGEFNVALTKQKFMIDRDYKKIWHILNWTNPGKFGKLHDFPEFDRDHFANLRNPYDDVWFTYDFTIEEYDFDKDHNGKEEFEKTLSDWAKKNGLPSRNSTEKPSRKRRSNPTKTSKGKRLKKKGSKDTETYNTSYHEQATVPIGDIQCENETGENTEGSSDKKNLRDITDLNYSKFIFSNEIQIIPKNNVQTRPLFKSSFVKRKFEFLEDRRVKETSNEAIKKIRSNDNKDVVIDRPRRESVFPSLEDILSFRKKPTMILDKPTTVTNTKLNTNTSLGKQKVNQKSSDLNSFSLEDIFKCKRNLHDNLDILKKLQSNESIPKGSPTIPKYSKVNNTKNNAMKKTEQLIVDSKGNHVKHIKLSNRTKVIHKRVPQIIATSTKETQTCNAAIGPKDLQDSSGKKDIAVGTTEFNEDKNSAEGTSDKSLIQDKKEVPESNTEDKHSKDRDNKSLDEIGLNSEPVQNKNSITENKEMQNENGVLIKSDIDKGDATRDEEGNILLSIIEGKFTPRIRPAITPNTPQKSTNSEAIISSKPIFTRYNSQVLLSSLFGDQIVSSESDNNNDSLDEDIISKLSKSVSDTQLQSQLRIKSIDQINNENSNQQNVCESLKVLFGVESEYLDSLSRNRKLGSCKPEKHNLLSSLFG